MSPIDSSLRAHWQGSDVGLRLCGGGLFPPLGTTPGICRLSEASWPEKMISFTGKREGGMVACRTASAPAITGGFYEVVMGPESSQPSLSFRPSLVTYSWGRGGISC